MEHASNCFSLKNKDSEMLKILIIEDEHIIALDLRESLEKMGYLVIGVCSKSDEVKETIRKIKPEGIICDINLNSKEDGIMLMEEMKQTHSFEFIYLTASFDKDTINKAMASGASYYLVKPFSKQQLEAAMVFLENKISEKVLSLPAQLSLREIEVIKLLAIGKSSSEIAQTLNISYHTITTHTKNIRKKLGMTSNMDVVAAAFKNKWI
jgi:DNA-binding NarL/FixJ family response regulator